MTRPASTPTRTSPSKSWFICARSATTCSRHEAGKSNRRIEDDAVLTFATASCRSVITLNRRDFVQLHRMIPTHAGIIVRTEDRDSASLARRVDAAIREKGELANLLVRVVRGGSD
ncbi:DUF5615 family PIN-like protein [Luteolibacter arcticus]|uniref:DUF5615 family PIN-like protein n=1 Tax=Luteolibacter arcticus TaxID=1581411 RepID=A0ABT3GLI2_9BACT|nr:DUF5615 family PIN-like protein [Luteolibacter arcticus]MCW1924383.1 DUF5615 family PIN-like protein [Luteolibacter arcticus]